MGEKKQHSSHDHSQDKEEHFQQNADDGIRHATRNHSIHAMSDHTAHVTHQSHAMPASPSLAHGDHSAHAGHDVDHTGHEKMFRDRLWWCLLLSIPVLLYSGMIQMWLGFTPPSFPFSKWIPFLFSVIIFGYGGIPFLQMALPELRGRKPGMMTLISLAISVAFVYSVVAQFINLGEGFFWELVTLIDIMLLGHWLEMRSVRQASGALSELAKLMPDTAERIGEGDRIESMPASQLKTGDLVLIRPGASIPADGKVVDGHSNVSEALITGESKPVHKMAGAKVIAGTINGDGSLRVRVTATGNETALAGIMRLVEQAQQSKSKTQVLADKAAGWLFYVAIVAAIVTAIAWIIAQGLNLEVLNRVVTVLVIACPHALGLAVPLVVAITTAMGARNGILVRDRLALEAARDIDVVIFDKTGTLTEGNFGVVDIATADSWNFDLALGLAAAIEGDSEHLIAQAIRHFARERKLTLPQISNFSAVKGRGVKATAENETYYVGGPRLLEMLSLTPESNLAMFTESANKNAQTVVY
jgi:P-type Cu2+ transporter